MSMDVVFIIGGIVLLAWLVLGHTTGRGKKMVEYLGYHWDIHLVKKGGRKEKTISVQSIDARAFLIHYAKLFGAQQGALKDLMSECHEIKEIPGLFHDWDMTYKYVWAGSSYAPLQDGGAPAVIRFFAVLSSTMDTEEEWEIKSIEQSGWSEVSVEQVALN